MWKSVFVLLPGSLIILFCEQGADVKSWKVICCFEYYLHCTEYDLHSQHHNHHDYKHHHYINHHNSCHHSLTALPWGSSKYLAAQESHFSPTLSRLNITLSSHGGQLSLTSGFEIQVNKGFLVPNLEEKHLKKDFALRWTQLNFTSRQLLTAW